MALWGSSLIADHQAQRNEKEARRMQQVTEYDGETELWFGISFDVGSHTGIEVKWKGTDSKDARDSFLEWLNRAPKVGTIGWRTLSVTLNGAERELTFQAAWVSGFTINPLGGKLRA